MGPSWRSAHFAPTGVLGLAFWYALYPVHGLTFSALIDAVREETEALEWGPDRSGSSQAVGAARLGSAAIPRA